MKKILLLLIIISFEGKGQNVTNLPKTYNGSITDTPKGIDSITIRYDIPLPIDHTYNGAPIYPGSYTVKATLVDKNEKHLLWVNVAVLILILLLAFFMLRRSRSEEITMTEDINYDNEY